MLEEVCPPGMYRAATIDDSAAAAAAAAADLSIPLPPPAPLPTAVPLGEVC